MRYSTVPRRRAKIRTNEEVKRRFGENFKTHGRDGSKRTRVRFNLEGQYGTASFIFVEVSDSMPSGEFVYVIV